MPAVDEIIFLDAMLNDGKIEGRKHSYSVGPAPTINEPPHLPDPYIVRYPDMNIARFWTA